MTFSILDFLDLLEPSKGGKYLCPACGGNDFTINKTNGAYSCWHDSSAPHRAEIRDALAPMIRWEKPMRDPGRYAFVYKDKLGEEVVVVNRDDSNGTKRIWQDFPTVDKSSSDHKNQLQEIKARILPYKYEEAVATSTETGLPIIVVEGELTCQAVWSVGLPSITFLGGSKQYRTNGDYTQLFRGLKLVLAPDRDEQGVAFMKEIEADNPGAQWLYADPRSWEWKNLPNGNGLDLADYIEDGATQDDLLASITSQSKHKGQDGKPSYEEIISSIEHFVGLYVSDVRIAYETASWLEARGVKMSQANIDKLIHEGKERVYGRQELDTIDALEIAKDDKCREWLIAGILPLGSVMLLAASGGTGKAQPLSSKILTPTGWKLMGDIQLGDEVITGDGSVTKVTGVFPQGKKPIFKVQMSDGATTHCCDEHMWLTKNQNQRDRKKDWTVRSLREIRKTLHLHKNNGRKDRNHSVPMVGPVQFEKQELPIDPYVLGVLLGDGCLAGNFDITISDDEIADKFWARLKQKHSLSMKQDYLSCKTYSVTENGSRNGMRNILRGMGLWGCRSWEKFIPREYLFASVQQRLDLLHGLMDTDGTTDGHSTTFDSSSKDLADAVAFIVQSLGGKCSRSIRKPCFEYKGEHKAGRDSYRVFISMPNGFKSFWVDAKAEKEIARTKYQPCRMVDSVEYIGDDDAQCIMVDHPSHTYVTDDFIVTHNSTLIYNWSLNIALGQPWSKRRCRKGKSLIIQSDEPLVDTSEKLGVIGYAESGLEPGDIEFWETWRFAHMTQLEDYVRKHKPSFIAIDSLTACLAGMDVDLVRSNAGDVLYGLRDIANKYSCSIVILHHLNKSGGLRDSTSFVDNVSEVVKLTRPENNPDPNQFVFEWLKSRSGLTGKHNLQRSALNYGWEYQGPAGGSIQELDGCINAIVNRPNERFTRQQVAALVGSYDIASTGKMLEVARRQGFIKSTFQDGPNDEKVRLYHSFDYKEHDWTVDESTHNESASKVEEKKEDSEDYDWMF
jgi:hypothetical protein